MSPLGSIISFSMASMSLSLRGSAVPKILLCLFADFVKIGSSTFAVMVSL